MEKERWTRAFETVFFPPPAPEKSIKSELPVRKEIFEMRTKFFTLTMVLVLSLVLALPAYAEAPNFSPAIFADGVAWGTKGLSDLPPATEDTLQSFDLLFGFTNGVDGQMAVAEAGPGNPLYNGGRWYAHTATWTDAAIAYYQALNQPLPLVTSYTQLMDYVNAGEIVTAVNVGHTFFLCPLLPVMS
jgi:hypothetical protein